MNKKKQVIYLIIDDIGSNPFMDLKVFSDGSEALKDLGTGNSLRAYEVEDKAQITKYNEISGKKGEK